MSLSVRDEIKRASDALAPPGAPSKVRKQHEHAMRTHYGRLKTPAERKAFLYNCRKVHRERNGPCQQ